MNRKTAFNGNPTPSLRLEAIGKTLENYPDLAEMLINLGNMLERRFNKKERMEDLDKAIQRTEHAVKITPENHLDLAEWLNKLGW
jgi:hypothetical protein